MNARLLILSFVIVLASLAGCKTTSKQESLATAAPEPKIVAVGDRNLTVAGAVIVKHSPNAFYYKGHCDACGHTMDKQIGSGMPEKNFTLVNDFTCPKCGHKQHIRIESK